MIAKILASLLGGHVRPEGNRARLRAVKARHSVGVEWNYDRIREDLEYGAYFRPSDTRPLSIVNCDNRVVASAIRWRWEANLDGFIRQRQRGFQSGRSIRKHLVEVESTV